MKIISLNLHPNNYKIIADVSPILYLRIKKIQAFDVFDKTKIYMHYFISQISSKNNFIVVDTSKENLQNGWPESEKTFKQIAFFYLWKDIKIKTIDEFYSEENIKIMDCGEDWKSKGFAQRWWIESYGVYDYFWKFESEFNLC